MKSNAVTEVNLVYRNKKDPAEYPQITDPGAAYDLFLRSWEKGKIDLVEQFRIMLLDSKNGCMGISTSATGCIASCEIDLKIVFATALKARASKIILAHNHPSGNLKPSEADKKLSTRFAEAGKLLDLPVIDHLIVTRKGFTSLNSMGVM